MLCSQGDGKGVCHFYPYRMGTGRPKMRLLRAYCLKCMNGSPSLVRLCPSQKCRIWMYRMGHNPKRAGQGDEGRLKKPLNRVLTGVF